MIVGISPPVFDPRGALVLDADPTSAVWTGTRRYQRRQTLDGGVHLLDGGYTDGDSTITIAARRFGKADVEYLQYLIRFIGKVHVALDSGFFLAGLQNYSVDGGVLTVTLLIERRLDGG